MNQIWDTPYDFDAYDRACPKHSDGIRCGLCGGEITDAVHLDIYGDTYHVSCYVHEYGRATYEEATA